MPWLPCCIIKWLQNGDDVSQQIFVDIEQRPLQALVIQLRRKRSKVNQVDVEGLEHG